MSVRALAAACGATVDSRQPLLSVRHSGGGSPIGPSTSTPQAVGVPSASPPSAARRVGVPSAAHISRLQEGGCPISGPPSAASHQRPTISRPSAAICRDPITRGQLVCRFGGSGCWLDDEAAVAVLGGLQFDERSVTAVRVAEQTLGRALLDDPSVLQKNDSVGARHGRQSMRDDHDKLVLGGLL